MRAWSALLLGLAASALCPVHRLMAQGPAPDITVVATPAFRPTAVLLPHLHFWVAVDSGLGVVLKNLTINPVTFTGWVRVEGIEAGARRAERRPFADSVRFSPDGAVRLLVADSAIGAPLTVEPEGDPAAEGGKLVITAPRWPYDRVVLVTIDPADLYEHRWRSVGYGVRDRVRVDDERHLVFLRDTTIARTVIAIGAGRGTQAAISTETTSIVLTRSFGGAVGRERVPLGRLVFALDPERLAGGGMRAELVFALGTTEQDAAAALERVAAWDPAPRTAWGPRVATPAPDVAVVLAHILGAAQPMLRYGRIAGFRNIPAGSYTFLAAFDRDGWYGATTALQLDDPEVVCSEYALFKRYADPSGAQRHEIWNRLGAQGPYLWTDAWGGRGMGDKDPYEILKGYDCYRATRDPAWLAAELPNLRRIAAYILATERNGDGLVEGLSDATYSEMNPLAADGRSYLTEDPYVNALAAYALDRLAELEDAARGIPGAPPGDSAAVWRAAARRIRAALPRLWRPRMHWFTYHAMAGSSRSWDHYHLQPVDALVFGAVTDSAMRAAMLGELLKPSWWDAEHSGFYAVPRDDSWFNLAGYWTGWDWHIMDFKAYQALFTYGTPAQRREAWRRLAAEAARIVTVNYGRPGERGDNNGLFMFSAGSYLDLVGQGLFGVAERLDSLVVAPHVAGIADDSIWRLAGWRVSGDTLGVTYRPADRAATITLGSGRPRRLVVRFPWLVAGSCGLVSRPDVTQRFGLAPRPDRSAVLDLPAGAGPVSVTISASPCDD